jgi:hypothetical protein
MWPPQLELLIAEYPFGEQQFFLYESSREVAFV